jgi:Rrf2 family protein
MKISAKTRYGIASLVCLARNYNAGTTEYTTIISLSDKLKISKIYLEQVFSLLKRARIVISTKGSQGGYHLSRPPNKITAYDIFDALETSLTEKAKDTVSQSDESIETAMKKVIFDRLDETVDTLLSEITLNDLMSESEKYISTKEYMYYL